ncbi:MAG: serine hydrolase domain-containing protein [Pseudomonadota bacterium]
MTGDSEASQEVRCSPPPTRYKGSYASDRDTAGVYPDDLNPIIETYFEESAPGVIAGVWQNGMSIYMRAEGLSNVNEKRKRLATDRFEIASLAKEFTAVAIMQLVERDQLSLNDTVGRFFPNLAWGGKVTISHLLSHTSGLGNRTYSESYTINSPFDPEQALDQLSDASLAFEPGTDYLYSNAGMTLLALITEEVTGVSREAYLKGNVLGPAGMKETQFFWELSARERDLFSVGYFVSAGDVTLLPLRMHPTASYGSGDLVSTMSDLRRWHVALKSGTLISPESFSLMIEPVRLGNGEMSQRGLAFMVGTVAGEKVIYNSGDIYTHTRHAFLAHRDLSVIVNTNVDVDGNFDVAGRVRDQIIGKLMDSETMNMYGTAINVSNDY